MVLGIVLTWSLKNKDVFRIRLDFMVSVLQYAVKRVGVSCMRDFCLDTLKIIKNYKSYFHFYILPFKS